VCITCINIAVKQYSVAHGTTRQNAFLLYLQRMMCSETYCSRPSGVTGGCSRTLYHGGSPHASDTMRPNSTPSTM